MNKETRNFIWGLILLIICGWGLSIHLTQIINEEHRNIIDNLMMIGTIPGVLIGFITVHKSL